jgi:hypothetical protein
MLPDDDDDDRTIGQVTATASHDPSAAELSVVKRQSQVKLTWSRDR